LLNKITFGDPDNRISLADRELGEVNVAFVNNYALLKGKPIKYSMCKVEESQ